MGRRGFPLPDETVSVAVSEAAENRDALHVERQRETNLPS
jgi:hypothetical protein